MSDKEERILITKVSGECRNLRVVGYGSEGLYCAANPHSDWEKITKRTCKTCKREKFLTGITRQEAIEIIKKSLEQIQCWSDSFNDIIAETALNALLEGVEK